MTGTSFVSLFMYGIAAPSQLNYFNFDFISTLFGNSIFIFMCHHSISGIVYPVRPQSKVRPMFIYSFSLAAILLLLEGFLSAFAFGWVDPTSTDPFPKPIQKLYNQNFLAVPVVSQIVNFYPMLGVSAVPVMIITLRNNILQMLGKEMKNPKWWVNGLWSVGL